MFKVTRPVGVMLSLAAATTVLSACSEIPPGALAAKPSRVVVHKEYIPASYVTQQSCSGAVPAICGEEQVLEKQCWRIDVVERYDITDAEARKRYAEAHQGKTQLEVNAESHCVFPSEFDKIKVGDLWTAPKVTY